MGNGAAPKFSLLRRRAVSVFIVLNLSTALFRNTPWGLMRPDLDTPVACRRSTAACELAWIRKAVLEYAVWTGLEGRWSMMSRPPHMDLRYAIVARYGDGSEILMPLPGQRLDTVGTPDLWSHHFADRVELDLAAILASRSEERKAYARYLCRRFPKRDGAPIETVLWRYQPKAIIEPAEAREQGSSVKPLPSADRLLDRISCKAE